MTSDCGKNKRSGTRAVGKFVNDIVRELKQQTVLRTLGKLRGSRSSTTVLARKAKLKVTNKKDNA